MKAPLVVLDAFCGAGGSSTGALAALSKRDVEARLIAVNHWDAALATHSANHPGALHVKANVYRKDPRELVPDGKVDLFIASPTCTFFSTARGGKPISREQRYGRLTPTQVVRWCKRLDVRCLMVENVPEFTRWGPCRRFKGKDGLEWKPNPSRKGVHFRAWLRRLRALGFVLEWRVLNAADFGAATTRKRFFLIGRRDGAPLCWPAPTHDKDASANGLFGARVKPWRPAREIIDPSIRGESILTREEQLAGNTLRRFKRGAEKFGWPAPFVELLRRLIAGEPVDGEPLPPLPNGVIPRPMIVTHRKNDTGRSLDEPIPTVCAAGMHVGMLEPLVLGQHGGAAARGTSSPVPTIAVRGVVRMIAPYYGASGCVSVDDPLPTVTTRDRFALVTPTTHRDESNRSRTLDQPLPTITGANRGELAFLIGAFGERPGQAPRVHSLDEPAPTICAQGRAPLARGEVLEAGSVVWIDILYRLLAPHELAAAMGFPADYAWCGTKTQVVKQIGNAVCPDVAGALADALVGSSS